ncbi:hypothetical protein HMPREF1570_4506 [Klebsiella oxytoca KA-2]|nr:hypothetical protein HMPREF1570_4506 [Klebsiella oxytoca KA-2]
MELHDRERALIRLILPACHPSDRQMIASVPQQLCRWQAGFQSFKNG